MISSPTKSDTETTYSGWEDGVLGRVREMETLDGKPRGGAIVQQHLKMLGVEDDLTVNREGGVGSAQVQCNVTK